MVSNDPHSYSAAQGNPANPDDNGGYNSGMIVFSYIIGGIVVWSLIGWVLDILLETRWIVLVGAIVGLLGGMYLSFAQRFRASTNDGGAHRTLGTITSGSKQK